MILELLRFLAGALAILIPGILAAAAFSLGRDWLEKCIHGSCVGLAAAVYLAALVSHFDLRVFYPAWVGVGVFSLIYLPLYLVKCRRQRGHSDTIELNYRKFNELLIYQIS